MEVIDRARSVSEGNLHAAPCAVEARSASKGDYAPSLARRACRIIPFSVADGPHQMAADELMLELAAGGQATIRVYAWNPPTLSLGYFQRHLERLQNPRLAGMPWVRRPTGGGAIIHDNDLTYAIALPRHMRQGLSPSEWHCRIHHVLGDLLAEMHVPATVLGGERPGQHELDFLCFAVPQPGDVLLESRKIIGGAQRVRAGALLQHGSIQLPSITQAGRKLAFEIAAVLGWHGQESAWTMPEQQRIEQLAIEKYARKAWNEKR